eukprot:CAMPEP_0174305634 /NCGR_PEP_ID=MMETSP0809-20121228/61522_1 /TAXON_ID=73025 ORGANISM="Eutreptiella gymnastica-like, Strain CCMP1594" /NCGR_SAMPLE_ID=MMETSP0809 /ASSEMBLY_ACC=CAM_ASM_000658 /LENGTH=247 /DNA_ID=CAMNT_0015412139 /DNA_START=32 /DNA_END=775 /DNA_ORIENTATION=-
MTVDQQQAHAEGKAQPVNPPAVQPPPVQPPAVHPPAVQPPPAYNPAVQASPGYVLQPPPGYALQPVPGYAMQPPPPQPLIAPNGPNDWAVGLCDCFDDMGLCCLCFWFPCVTDGHTLAHIQNEDHRSGIYVLLACAVQYSGFSCCLSLWNRNQLRMKYGLHGDPCEDCMITWCCLPCANYQHAKQAGLCGCVERIPPVPQAMPGQYPQAMPAQAMSPQMPQAMPGQYPQAMPAQMPQAMPQALPGKA